MATAKQIQTAATKLSTAFSAAADKLADAGSTLRAATAEVFGVYGTDTTAAAETIRAVIENRATAYIEANPRPAGGIAEPAVIAWSNAYRGHVHNPLRAVQKEFESRKIGTLRASMSGKVTIVAPTGEKSDADKAKDALARALKAIAACDATAVTFNALQGAMLKHFPQGQPTVQAQAPLSAPVSPSANPLASLTSEQKAALLAFLK